MDFNIERMKSRLLVKYPFYGNITANTAFIPKTDIKTAATDGKNIYYNPTFVNSLKEEEQTFLFAHEICHIALNHIYRSEGKNQKLWNIATDAVINAHLQKDGLEIIKGGIDIPGSLEYDAEELYEKLLKEEQEKSNNNSQNNQNKANNQSNKSSSESDKGENEQPDVGHDTHSMWEDAIKNKNQTENNNSNEQSEKQQEKKESIFDKLFNKNKNQKQPSKEPANNNDQNEKKNDIDKLSQMGEKQAFEKNAKEKEKQIDNLRKAMARQSTSKGNTTTSSNINIDNIGTRTELIDWRRLLKESEKYDEDWTYQKASIEEGIVTPGLEDIRISETEILLDTSGSIDETLLRNFLRECKSILKASKVKVGCFDDEFYGFTQIHKTSDIETMDFVGGGGTDFDVAVNAFSRKAQNKIIFTDGLADMPDKEVDAIWIVFGGRKINPKGGKVIYIADEQLEKLSLITEEYTYQTKRR